MEKLKTMCRQFINDEDGATMIEYGLLAALIALVVAAAVVSIGMALNNKFQAVNNCVSGTTANDCVPA